LCSDLPGWSGRDAPSWRDRGSLKWWAGPIRSTCKPLLRHVCVCSGNGCLSMLSGLNLSIEIYGKIRSTCNHLRVTDVSAAETDVWACFPA
jgi:hypothetical protein